ncbi:MAG: hypothetical protein FJW30_03130 [Acidobacteria bacterium]|nr:hypothetical protein [Acidobacteriota bacterium]
MPRALIVLVALLVAVSTQCMAKCEIVPVPPSCHETANTCSVDQDIVVDAAIPAPALVWIPVSARLVRFQALPRVVAPTPPLRV